VEKNTYRWLLGIFIFALVLRLGWSSLAPALDPYLIGDPFQGDGIGYAALGWNLKNGDGFSWDAITPTSYRMPGYPALLALIFAAGGLNLAAVRVIQSIIGALTIFPVFWVALQLGGTRVGLLAATGVALYPLMVYLTGWIYSETLLIFLLWLGVCLLVKGLQQNLIWLGAFSGVMFGLTTLVRPEMALFPGFLAVWGILFHWGRPRIRMALIAQLGLIVVVLPWAIRNTVIHHQFVPLTTSGGSNFYAGNNPDAHGGSAWVFPLEGNSEVESDRVLAIRAIQWIRENPVSAFSNEFQKMQKFFSPVSFETTGAPIIPAARILDLIYLGFLSLAGWGAWKTLRGIPGAVMLLLVIWYASVALIFYGGSRVALPVAPAYIIFAAYTISRWIWRAPAPSAIPTLS
jgi:4-amino-4-deoxy-L-arabinose transferase-like glycosyltransferase